VFVKVVTVVGTVLVWLTVLSPAALAAVGLASDRVLRFDFLLPAELCPVALAGGGLLLWVALRTHSRRWLIGGGLAVAVAMLAGGMALASVTGLASGDIEPTGWQWAVVTASLAGYVLALAAVGVGGVLLLRDLD
jgi:hypothetical protein